MSISVTKKRRISRKKWHISNFFSPYLSFSKYALFGLKPIAKDIENCLYKPVNSISYNSIQIHVKTLWIDLYQDHIAIVRLRQLPTREQAKRGQPRVRFELKNRPTVFASRRFRTHLLLFLHWVLWRQTENANWASTSHFITILNVQAVPKYRYLFSNILSYLRGLRGPTHRPTNPGRVALHHWKKKYAFWYCPNILFKTYCL